MCKFHTKISIDQYINLKPKERKELIFINKEQANDYIKYIRGV
jgi:hypothetical protein